MKINHYIISFLDIIRRKIILAKSFHEIMINHTSFVIMFHDVSSDEKTNDKYWINRSDFEKCIDYIKRCGYQFILMSELEGILNYEKRYCVLTFDDGFHSTYVLMKEYLVKNKIPFHIFITSDWIGKEGYVSLKEVEEMAKEPLCSIGSHSKSHPKFRYLSKEEEEKELSDSKNILSDIIQDEIIDFAFPFGSWIACKSKNIKNAHMAGYLNVYSTLPTTLRNNHDRKSIPRINGVEIAKYIEKGEK